MAEALAFAQAAGLDLRKTLEAVSGGAAASWTLSNRGPQVLRRDFRPGFSVDLQQKDLRLVLEAADELGVPLQACSTAFHYYRAVQKRGGGGEGNHAIVKALEYLAGITVGAGE
jgi:3-hydroxyisobutyrate dehydrogenase